jgi:glycosyltransferase involved in cell wall biosynthesis
LRKVIIGYDLIPYIMQNEYRPSLPFAWNHVQGKKAKIRAILRATYYRFRYWIHYKVFLRADKVVCISQATADSFHTLLGIPKSRLEVSHLAPVGSATGLDFGIAKTIDKPYIFYIGGTDARKSISDIIHAYNIARGRGENIALVLAGNEFRGVESIPDIKGRNAIIDSPYRSDIHLVGFVTDEQKNGLYKNALAFIFTSRFEGFGLPIIEAMGASCPVISYNNSSIPEVAGDAAYLVKTGDIVDLAHGITELSDSEKRRDLVKKGLAQSGKFTWKAHVEVFLNNI